MRTRLLTPLSPAIAFIGVLLAAALLLFSAPSPAAAHDALIGSSPDADSSVETLPAEISLSFSAALIGGEGSTQIVVLDESGTSVSDGEATIDGAIVTQQLASEASAGAYRVLWKVVSSDGHPTSGEFSFTVEQSTIVEPTAEPAEEEATASPETPADDATSAEEPSEAPVAEDAASLSPLWIAVIIIVLVGIVVLVVLLRRRGRGNSASNAPSER
ncbi:copper resistance CopC family protein [uncultured Microbacterium sp.]|uniref:copper resistance CopC family protein n=1 Tax=uncultured Microbacterium sp. TaxID=191216 RepID=UPI00262ADAC6|nr:copper resistance CopC family protein [uncultured Microbacterium sp.]